MIDKLSRINKANLEETVAWNLPKDQKEDIADILQETPKTLVDIEYKGVAHLSPPKPFFLTLHHQNVPSAPAKVL